MSRCNVWPDEDGERWFADGHHSMTSMQSLVEALEVECNGQPHYDAAVRAIVESGYVTHSWWLEDCNDEERMITIKGWWRILGARLFLGCRPFSTLYGGCGLPQPAPSATAEGD